MDERLHHLFARMPDAKVHLYGKGERPDRKIGHVNVLGARLRPLDDDEYVAPVRERAERAAHWMSQAVWTDGWDVHGDAMSGRVEATAAGRRDHGQRLDWPTMEAAAEALAEFGMPFEVGVVSAHRTPQRMLDYARDAAGRGIQVIIAGAGGAAHLPGMVASATPLPVIGVPVPLKYLDGMDSLLSIVQMPAGVPVATVSIGGARNAGLLAVRILAASDPHCASGWSGSKRAWRTWCWKRMKRCGTAARADRARRQLDSVSSPGGTGRGRRARLSAGQGLTGARWWSATASACEQVTGADRRRVRWPPRQSRLFAKELGSLRRRNRSPSTSSATRTQVPAQRTATSSCSTVRRRLVGRAGTTVGHTGRAAASWWPSPTRESAGEAIRFVRRRRSAAPDRVRAACQLASGDAARRRCGESPTSASDANLPEPAGPAAGPTPSRPKLGSTLRCNRCRTPHARICDTFG